MKWRYHDWDYTALTFAQLVRHDGGSKINDITYYYRRSRVTHIGTREFTRLAPRRYPDGRTECT